jgi:hypothetical protein
MPCPSIMGTMSALRTAAALALILAGCTVGTSEKKAAPTSSVDLQHGPVLVDWSIAATGRYADTSWILESRGEGKICPRLRDKAGQVLVEPGCVPVGLPRYDVAGVVTTALVEPHRRYGYLLGVTDPRVELLDFELDRGRQTVPVSRQVFVLWTRDPFGDPRQYEAVGERRVLATFFCAPEGCP